MISNANELLNYSKGEEELAEKFVQKLVTANINTVVSGGSISDIVLHFLDKYKVMVIKILSKFELRRVARGIRATILSKYYINDLDWKVPLLRKQEKLMRYLSKKLLPRRSSFSDETLMTVVSALLSCEEAQKTSLKTSREPLTIP